MSPASAAGSVAALPSIAAKTPANIVRLETLNIMLPPWFYNQYLDWLDL
jgi:hypothetical protein